MSWHNVITCVCVCLCLCVCLCSCVCVCVCVLCDYVCVFVCLFVCAFVFLCPFSHSVCIVKHRLSSEIIFSSSRIYWKDSDSFNRHSQATQAVVPSNLLFL